MTERRKEKTTTPQRQSLVVVDTCLALIVCLLIVQMWLLTASLEEYLAGNTAVAMPGAVVSGILFIGCLALFVLVRRVEKNDRKRSDYETLV